MAQRQKACLMHFSLSAQHFPQCSAYINYRLTQRMGGWVDGWVDGEREGGKNGGIFILECLSLQLAMLFTLSSG